MPLERREKGFIEIYTGDGKGKTTAALGLALRAVGHGFMVCMIQFLKGTSYTGELFAAQRLYPNFKIYQFGRDCRYAALIRDGFMNCTGCGECFIKEGEAGEEERRIVHMALEVIKDILKSREYQIVILDEVSHALHHSLVSLSELLGALREARKAGIEIVLTGRDFPPELFDEADLITEMRMVKHPFEKGVRARRGIEY